MTKTYIAIGLMSGTSMDGIDIAGLETDGETFLNPGPAGALIYSDGKRASRCPMLLPRQRRN